MRLARRLLLCGFASAALSTAVIATSAMAADADQVSELIVAGKSLEETAPLELARLGHDLVIVTGEEIKKKGYVDLAGALQMEVPGLYLASQAGPFSYAYLSLQGSRAQDVLWTVDGIRVNNRLYSGTLPNDTLPSSMIERIEVLKGGESLFYGTQGIAGVINVVTRSFSDTFGGEVNIGGDTNNGFHADGYVRGAAGRHRYVAFASKDTSDGFKQYDIYQPSATMRRRGYDVQSAGVKYGFDLTDDLSLSASYIHTDADLDYPGARLTAFSQNQRDEDIFGAKLDYAPDQGLQFYLKAYHHDWDSHYTTVNNVVGSPGATKVVDDGTYWGYRDTGVNALAKLPVGGFDYLLGYDFQTYKARDDVLRIEPISEDVNAIFGQIQTNADLSDRYRFAAGVRYNKTGGNEATVWNVSGRYDITPALFVQGNVGASFSLPTAEQLFAIDPDSTFGNARLKPEEGRSLNVSLGGRFANDRVEWLLTGFDRTVKNLIAFTTDLALIPTAVQAHPDFATSGEAYVNLGEAEFSGFDAMAATMIGDAVRISASYTHTKARDKGDAFQIGRIPEDLVKAQIAWEPINSRYGASASAIWTGDVFQAVQNEPKPVNFGNYYVVDLAAHAYLDDGRKHRLTARLQNLFDEDYATAVRSVVTDSGSPARITVRNLGAPRTFNIRYSYAFGG